MDGNELYERIRMGFAQHGILTSHPHELFGSTKVIWDEIAERITNEALNANPPCQLALGSDDDNLMRWINDHQPPTLKRLYQLLNRMGYRI